MVWHRFELDDWRVLFGAHFRDDLFESLVDGAFDDGTPVLRAPEHVIGAAVYDVVVGSDLVHPNTIRQERV